jgi:multidrug resistance efflux pump
MKGGMMDYSTELDRLQRQVDQMKSAVQSASTESREELRRRIDQAQTDADRPAPESQQGAQAREAQSKWAKMRSDANDKMTEVKARMDKRDRQTDAKVASEEANWAENDALNAIDFASRSLDNARLVILDAIDGRAFADAQASRAR